MKKFVLILSLLLVGCANSPSIYNPTNLEVSGLAVVAGEDLPMLTAYFHSSIISVYDELGSEVISTNFSKRFHEQVSLAPGNYIVVLRCADDYMYGFPAVDVSLEAGEKYIGYCRRIREDGSTVGIEGIVLHKNKQAPPGP